MENSSVSGDVAFGHLRDLLVDIFGTGIGDQSLTLWIRSDTNGRAVKLQGLGAVFAHGGSKPKAAALSESLSDPWFGDPSCDVGVSMKQLSVTDMGHAPDSEVFERMTDAVAGADMFVPAILRVMSALIEAGEFIEYFANRMDRALGSVDLEKLIADIKEAPVPPADDREENHA